MNNDEFDKIVEQRKNKISEVLQKKSEEYSSDIDRLYNFKAAANLDYPPETPEIALKGMLKKHLVSVIDIVNFTETNPDKITFQLIDEKIGDTINYLILLEALLFERLIKKTLDIHECMNYTL